jgi:hypothetical protein
MVIEAINRFVSAPYIDGGWLVHGYPTLEVHPFKPYGHAWVEREEDGVTWVYDYSNGQTARVPASLYYAVGNIDPAHTRRYSEEAAMRMIVKAEHYGIWHDGPEDAI